MYDYYPNSILDLKIITGDITDEITDKVRKILSLAKKKNQVENDLAKKVMLLRHDIDEILNSYFNLTKKEIEIINSMVNPPKVL